MNQLPVSERRDEPCGTSLHGSTVGYKPDPCGSLTSVVSIVEYIPRLDEQSPRLTEPQ